MQIDLTEVKIFLKVLAGELLLSETPCIVRVCVLIDMAKQFDYMDDTAEHCEDIDVKPIIEPLGIFLIVIGIILLIVSVFGILGACCNSRLLLAVVSPSMYLLANNVNVT